MSLLFVVIITMIKQGYEDYLRSIMLNLLYFNSKTIDPGKNKVSFKVNSLLIFDQLPLKDQLDVHNICFNYLHHKPTISYFRSLPVIIMSIWRIYFPWLSSLSHANMHFCRYEENWSFEICSWSDVCFELTNGWLFASLTFAKRGTCHVPCAAMCQAGATSFLKCKPCFAWMICMHVR